ncbi:transposase family protein [Leptospira borgpetersenii]|uniref:transposase family protein n=1 Tax=Leptospira borgpetersenii TaxID=174 RepID=UPI001F08C956|nr:transposase family protein [Leptospira borgpetersenii]
MDTTILRVQDGSKAYIHFIMDNFSRMILGWKASLEWNAKNTVSNLKEVCEKFNLFTNLSVCFAMTVPKIKVRSTVS